MTDRDQPRFVVGVDGSDSSKQALEWALALAQRTGAVVDAVAAWQFPHQLRGRNVRRGHNTESLAKANETALNQTITEVAGPNPPVTIRPRVLAGHPAFALMQQAEGADLPVLGYRGHGGFVGALLGSVTQHCVQQATCPVVVIRGPRE
jgi:nucleotide-binding universal stress UspA family protein